MAGPDEALRAAIEDSKVVDKGMAGDRAYCTNPRCLKKGDVKNPLKGVQRLQNHHVLLSENFFLRYVLSFSCIFLLSLNARGWIGHGTSRIHVPRKMIWWRTTIFGTPLALEKVLLSHSRRRKTFLQRHIDGTRDAITYYATR